MPEKKVKPYEIIREGNEDVLRLNYESVPYTPSIEGNPVVMMDVIDKLAENPSVAKIMFMQRRHYNYSHEQTQMLQEVATIYSYLTKRKKALSPEAMGTSIEAPGVLAQRHSMVREIVFELLRSDPLGAYVELKRMLRIEHVKQKTTEDPRIRESRAVFVALLEEILGLLEATKLIQAAKSYLAGYTLGDRSIYRLLLKATITPDFMYTKVMASPPMDGEEIDIYSIEKNTEVTVFKIPNDIKYLYHLNPPEFKLSEDKYTLVDLAKNVLAEHEPREEQFLDPQKLRTTFSNIGRDLLRELADHQGMDLTVKEVRELTEILIRHTIGFGFIELILKDKNIQDISINSPNGEVPIFVLHGKYDNCITNIVPARSDVDSWASKFRLLSARPLDEANPILDTELTLPDARSRVSIVTKPLNPYGQAFSFRRHRDDPWTLPLFIKVRMINPLAAGLMSFLIDGARTLLIAGTRSSGKCLRGSTKIMTTDGKLATIGNIVEEKIKSNGFLECDDGYYSFVNDLDILTLDDQFKIKKQKVQCVWKRTSPEYLYKIKLRSGKKLIVTPEHPVLASSYDYLGYKRSDEISIGEKIAAPRRFPFVNGKISNLENPSKSLFSKRPKAFKVPEVINDNLLEIIGYILADGYAGSTKLEFINSEEILLERYREKVVAEFGLIPKLYVDKRNDCKRLCIFNKNLMKYFDKILQVPIGKKSHRIFIPDYILQLPNNRLSIFLKALFDCDGYIAKSHREIEYSTKSKILAEQLQIVLHRFGIISSLKIKIVKSERYYSLFIYGKEIKKFAKHIGFNHPKKMRRLENLAKYQYLETTNIDSIPYGNKILKELRKELRISPSKLRKKTKKDYWAYENLEYSTSRKWLKHLISFYSDKYNAFKQQQGKIKQLKNFVEVAEKKSSMLNTLSKMLKLLNISYIKASKNLPFSDSNLRKIFRQKKVDNFDYLKSFCNLKPTILGKASWLMDSDFSTLNSTMNTTPFTYSALSGATGIPETTLKAYSYQGIKPSIENEYKLSKYIQKYRLQLEFDLRKISFYYSEISDYMKNLEQNNKEEIILLLNLFRRELNIQNEEFVSGGISGGTVTGFFNNYYDASLNTLVKLSKKAIELYEKATSSKIKQLLEKGMKLASSDLFWDEVIEVKKIKSKSKWVYDLTVEPTHNFVANGIIAHNTSLLGSCLVEIMRKYRIISIEDTLELPGETLRKLGYDIQPLKVRSALVHGGTELSAAEGIRTSLRMGDSSLIVGEVRSKEAIALYEAMRIGAMANVVAGTIHGDSPYGVFDRVVNDLGVPRTSFKATDVIIVANPLKSPDGLHKWRRVTQITEVRKEWERDPLAEGAFVDLLKYNAHTDELEVTPELMNGESEIVKAIGANVKEWAGNWDAIWNNILLRADIKKLLVDYSNRTKNPKMLEAPFVIQSNDWFHRISDSVREDVGEIDIKRIRFEWEDWLKNQIRKGNVPK